MSIENNHGSLKLLNKDHESLTPKNKEERVKRVKEKPKGNWDISIQNELTVKISKRLLSSHLPTISEE